MGLFLPDTQNCGLCMHLECRERFLRHRLQRKPLARAVMHVGIANPRWQGKRSRHSRRIPKAHDVGFLVWATSCWQGISPWVENSLAMHREVKMWCSHLWRLGWVVITGHILCLMHFYSWHLWPKSNGEHFAKDNLEPILLNKKVFKHRAKCLWCIS